MPNATAESMPDHPSEIAVCICTYRRPYVLNTIDSVAKQRLPQGTRVGIIVVDNDVVPSSRELVESYRPPSYVELSYVHAPGQNISIARNAGLDACPGRWLAFIDDDEFASFDWLAHLCSARADATAVFGPVEAVYPADSPRWLTGGDHHSTRIRQGQVPVRTGYSGNALFDVDFVRRHGIRFDVELGRTGGEDTVFFNSIFRHGGKLSYAPAAVAYEEAVSSRRTLRWVLSRQQRVGQSYALMLQRHEPSLYARAALTSLPKIGFSLVAAAATAASPSRASWWLARAWFHVGVLSYRLRGRVREEYARPAGSAG
jgi:succinoglycan biosynthesis protein ExoM